MNFNKPYSEMTPKEQAEYRADLERDVHLGKLAMKLKDDESFKELIMKHYTEEEPVRLTWLMGDAVAGTDEKHRININERLIGIAQLMNFMREKIGLGYRAEQDLYRIDHPEVAEMTYEEPDVIN